MRQILPLLLALPLAAADTVPPQPPVQPAIPTVQPLQQPGIVPAPDAGPVAPPSMPRPEVMKELREIESQWRQLREKADLDPGVQAARKTADETRKGYLAKQEEVMAKEPGFAELKAKREEIRAKLMPRPPGPPGAPGAPGMDGEHHKPNGVPPAPPLPPQAPPLPKP